MNPTFKEKFLPHLIILFLFWLGTAIYFKPAVFDGKSLKQGDAVTWTGNAQEITEHRNKYHEEPLWTNAMFSGMPAYTISVIYNGEILEYLENSSRWVLPYPISIVFVSLICFYIFGLSLRMSPVAAAFGALAFTFFSFTMVSMEAGHNSKVRAMTLAPLVLAGMAYAFQRKWLWALALTALGTAMQIRAGHYQISYYLVFIAGFYGLSELIVAIKQKSFKDFSIAFVVMIAGVGLGTATNAGRLMTLMEYSPYSMRGKPELSIKDANKPKDGGLDKDYVFSWSNTPMETFTLLIPHFYGGSSSELIPKKSEIGKYVSDRKDFPFYWGDQPFTSGPVYAGAVVCFLFILGLFILEGRLKWWLLAATLFSIMLSWGKHFEDFNYLMFDYLPGYNKFRAVTMAIFIAQFAVATMAALSLAQLFSFEKIKDGMKNLYWSAGITAGLCLIFAVIPDLAGEFSSPNDKQLTGGEPVPPMIMEALVSDRIGLLTSDAWRSFLFVLSAAVLVFLIFKSIVKPLYATLGIAVLGFIDLWSVDKRYLNKENFEKSFWTDQFQPSAADQKILAQKGFNNRVLNLNNPFNESKTSYFHKSIGGYSPVKIRRYQDLIENDLTQEIQNVSKVLQSWDGSPDFLRDQRILNMLNTKYLKGNETENGVIVNPFALGNAWFVQQVQSVNSPDEEMAATRTFNPSTTAIVDQQKFKVSGKQFSGNGKAVLTEARGNLLKYSVENSGNGLLVFSEIYYPEGWVATIDGKECPVIRANYVLRAMEVPAGKHEIVFRFEPKSFSIGNKISLFSSIAVLALLGFTGFMSFRKKETKPE